MPDLSAAEVAALLGITARAVCAACVRGCFPGARKPGRDWMIPPDAVDFYRGHHLGRPGRKRPTPPTAPAAAGGGEKKDGE